MLPEYIHRIMGTHMTNKFLSWPIRRQFISILLIAALPAIFLITRSSIMERNHSIDEAKQQCLQLVNDIATVQQATVAGAEQLLSALSQIKAVRTHKPEDANLIFSELIKINSQYRTIVVADKYGVVWASATPFEGKVSVVDRKWYRDAVLNGMFSSGEYTVGRITKSVNMNFGMPVKNAAGEVIAVLGISLDLNYAQRMFDKVHLPSGASFSLVDHQGINLIRNLKDKFSATIIGRRDIINNVYPMMKDGPDEGTFETMGNDGQFRLAAYKKLRLSNESEPYIYIRSSIPFASVATKANAAMLKNLTLFSLLFGMVLLLAGYVGKHVIVVPVGHLTKAAEQLGADGTTVKMSSVVKVGELGQLARAFDEMAEALRQREIAKDVAQEALQKSRNQFQVLTQNLHSGVALIDERGCFSIVNPSFLRLFGLSDESDINNVNDRDWTQWQTFDENGSLLDVDEHPVRKAAITGKPVQDKLVAVRAPLDKDLKWMLISAYPILKPDGRMDAVICNYYDITKRRQTEYALAEHTARLEEVNKELESFAYSVSHDLRAPLRHMSGFVELLQRKLASDPDEKTRHYTEIISAASKKMGMLIDDLLAFSRIRRSELQKKVVDVNKLVREVVRELATETELEGRDIEWKIGNLPDVYGDPSMLRLAFVNLISNAVKFSRPRPRAEIDIACLMGTDGRGIFFVKDNGVGFDMKFKEKLFGVFQRLHHDDEFEGNGIGLANVQRIISRHGGKTWAEGVLGQGATFYFTLPITEEAKTCKK